MVKGAEPMTSSTATDSVRAEHAVQDSSGNDEKHIRYVEETDDSIVIGFAKNLEEESDSEKSVDPIDLDLKAAFKAIESDDESDQGVFEGYASVFNNTDLGNDVIKTGAFTKSIRRRKNSIKLLWQHQSDNPIGVFDSIKEDEKGLYVKGRLVRHGQGEVAYELLKMGALDGMSIGFRVNPNKVSYDKRTRKRVIEEVDLMEISLVTFPMNQLAKVEKVKSEGEGTTIREWERLFREEIGLSRSDAKIAAGAAIDGLSRKSETVSERLGEESVSELVDAMNNLSKTLTGEQL